MTQATASLSPAPPGVDLTPARRDARSPWLVAAAVAVVVALPMGAFALGRATASADADAARRGAISTSAPGDTSAGVATDSSSRGAEQATWDRGASEGSGYTLTALGDRTAHGVVLRVHAQQWPAAAPVQPVEGEWSVPVECYTGATIQIGASNDAAVRQTSATVAGILLDPVLTLVGRETFGVVEGAPTQVVTVAVGIDVATVRGEFDDGTIDEAAVVGDENGQGWAVLASRGPVGGEGTPAWSRGRIVALDSKGTALGAHDIDSSGVRFDPACSPPPPALPDPTGPPPADEADARAEVVSALEAVFSTGNSDEVFAAAAEGGSELLAVRTAARESSLVPAGGTAPRVDDLRFLDESTAAVRYSIVNGDGGPILSNQIGRVVLRDGRWQVTRETVCAVFALVAECPG